MNIMKEFNAISHYLGKLFPDGPTKPFAVFGTGAGAFIILGALAQKNWELECFVDNNPAKQGSSIAGRPVISADELLANKDHLRILIASDTYYNEIKNQLTGKGLQEWVDFMPALPTTLNPIAW